MQLFLVLNTSVRKTAFRTNVNNKESDQSGYMRSDDVQNVNYSNDDTDFENTSMV